MENCLVMEMRQEEEEEGGGRGTSCCSFLHSFSVYVDDTKSRKKVMLPCTWPILVEKTLIILTMPRKTFILSNSKTFIPTLGYLGRIMGLMTMIIHKKSRAPAVEYLGVVPRPIFHSLSYIVLPCRNKTEPPCKT